MNKPLLISLLLTSTLGLSAFASAADNITPFSQQERPAMNEMVNTASTTPAQQLQVKAFSQRARSPLDNQTAETRAAPVNHALITPFSQRERPAMDQTASTQTNSDSANWQPGHLKRTIYS